MIHKVLSKGFKINSLTWNLKFNALPVDNELKYKNIDR